MSLSDVRAKHRHIRFQRALTQLFSMTQLVLFSFRGYGDYLLVSLEYSSELVEPLVRSYDNTIIYITVKRIQEHRAHAVGPLSVCLGLGLAVTFMIAMPNAVLESKIRLSHCRDGVTFWLPRTFASLEI